MKYFKPTMSSSEARSILFSSVGHMSEIEVQEMKEEYRQVVPEIVKREFSKNAGWLTEEKI